MEIVKTPRVYIVEKNPFPNSVVEVATAVPAFIGYTAIADNRGEPLSNKPWRVTSMAEFEQYFGSAPTASHVKFTLIQLGDEVKPASPDAPLEPRDCEPLNIRNPRDSKETKYLLTQTEGFYLLYYSMLNFFHNGGGPCYIVSVGTYEHDSGIRIEAKELIDGIDALKMEQEPTMLVIPEAVLLSKDDCITVQRTALRHCGEVMRNRIAILDIWQGYRERNNETDCVANFRNGIGIDFLGFGTAYYPWINTTIVPDQDLSYRNIESASLPFLVSRIAGELGIEDGQSTPQFDEVRRINDPSLEKADRSLLNHSVIGISPFFNTIVGEMLNRLNVLPPSAAIAGIYAMVDSSRGVWKAPANVGLNSVISPTVSISSAQQEDLNVSPQGKSINAIRSFVGEGTLVWGARTLDGNSSDWRYINVRRTMIMLEQSIRLATEAMLFEANVANTWLTIKSMVSNFLTGIWKRGGLAGAVPDDAFSVHVGLGETMTAEDILAGILRVTVLVAIIRPAEFIEITFQQQMQKS
jgi:uncharacterized protein